jgi:hypothetical protein
MTTLQSNDTTGAVVIFGNPACPPTPKPGYTIRTVEALPTGAGPLRWDAATSQLVRDSLPEKLVPTLTARQLRLWLIGAGMTLESIDGQINAIPDAKAQAEARVEWEYATSYHHDHPLVVQIGTALGLSQTQIDTAFRAAALL